MRSVLDEFDISKIKWLNEHVLPLWVYGTLRTEERFHYYLQGCSDKVGEYQMDGTLMQTASGDVYVVKTGTERKTMGELYRVSLSGLWRIFHLENQSGSFPKAYDLSASKIFETTTGHMRVALWFRRLEDEALPISDFKMRKTLLQSLLENFENKEPNLPQNDVDHFLSEWLSKQSERCC